MNHNLKTALAMFAITSALVSFARAQSSMPWLQERLDAARRAVGEPTWAEVSAHTKELQERTRAAKKEALAEQGVEEAEPPPPFEGAVLEAYNAMHVKLFNYRRQMFHEMRQVSLEAAKWRGNSTLQKQFFQLKKERRAFWRAKMEEENQRFKAFHMQEEQRRAAEEAPVKNDE